MTPRYGLDAPHEMRVFSLIGIAIIAVVFVVKTTLLAPYPGVATAVFYTGLFSGIGMLLPLVTIPFGSLVLKKRARDWLLDGIEWSGIERVLDVGCGRGLLLVGCAKRLQTKTARVVGIDLWRAADQTGNHPEATKANCQSEGVLEQVEVQTGDARALPFKDASFDLIVSSWALHNIRELGGREAALAEIVRVLKPGGLVAIMDIEKFGEYKRYFLGRAELLDVQVLGPRFTFGNRTCIVKARKK